jgi:hypothetical protein
MIELGKEGRIHLVTRRTSVQIKDQGLETSENTQKLKQNYHITAF